MNELRQLVRRFLSGELNYKQFRREFGPFFSRSDADPLISKVCELIESECSAFEHGIIDAMGLKVGLSIKVAWSGAPSRNANNPVQRIQINTQQAFLVIQPNEARNAPAPVQLIARVA